MAFVAAKCTQCGASIEVDESKEAGICSHCGTAFITEKAINNYNITNNVVNNVTQNIETAIFKTGDDESDYVQRVAAHALTGSRYLIEKTAKEMQEKFPHKGITYVCKADSILSYDQWTNNRIDVPALKEEIEDYEQTGRSSHYFGEEKKLVRDYYINSAKEALAQADKMMTPAEKEKYAEYVNTVREKVETCDTYAKYHKEAEQNRMTYYANQRRKKKKILACVISALVVAVAVVITVLVLK